MRTSRKTLSAAAALAVLVTTVTVPSASAAAASPPALSDFQLVPTQTDKQTIVDQLDARLPKLGVQNILTQANRDDAPKGAACTSPALDTNTLPVRDKFCFNDGDVRTTEWVPQGITTVADAQDDQYWGDKQAVLVSWYDKQTDPVKGVRVSFLDTATGNYQHVLLVYPYTNTSGNPSYEQVTTPQSGDHGSVHAGGIVWYGNYLYLVDTNRGIRMFDMRYIFDIKSAGDGDVTDSSRVGRHDGTYYSYGYRYVMPQVSGWSNPDGLAEFPPDYRCAASGPQKFSYLGLDRSTNPDSIVTGEYCADQDDDNLNGRVARWPLDGDTGKPAPAADGRWKASQAYRLPTPRVQGAVSVDNRWYLNSTGGGTTGPGHLRAAVPTGGNPGVLATDGAAHDVAVGVEDLSYWPGRDQLWTVTEHDTQRIMYAVSRP
ncbi:hypothetical protein BLA60_34965 [Actinophytocola xinjiangensis]|uniref:Secreted protein n=1 Tax=Actinophytocola xinjiangensis TaxID=485602 RepID=A0A7Z1AUY9_9PSEU|nr:hypothetical protein [Actinophytocola xinjiangensis]OLF05715.1 hypothetical protein BLA60_34965 [Actinophytocola xinjiangensis]